MNKKISIYAISIALAFVFSYIEYLFPLSLGIPGIKPGFANIVILIVIYNKERVYDVYAIALIRIILVGLTFGNLYSLMYSFAGTILATTIMLISYRIRLFSVVGTSILGGVFHNIGQLIAAIFLLSTDGFIYYLPILILAGTAAGLLTGLIASRVLAAASSHQS